MILSSNDMGKQLSDYWFLQFNTIFFSLVSEFTESRKQWFKAFKLVSASKLIQPSDRSLLIKLRAWLLINSLCILKLDSDYVVLLGSAYCSTRLSLCWPLTFPLTNLSASSLPLISSFSFSVSICTPYLTTIAYIALPKYNIYIYLIYVTLNI